VCPKCPWARSKGGGGQPVLGKVRGKYKGNPRYKEGVTNQPTRNQVQQEPNQGEPRGVAQPVQGSNVCVCGGGNQPKGSWAQPRARWGKGKEGKEARTKVQPKAIQGKANKPNVQGAKGPTKCPTSNKMLKVNQPRATN